VQLSSAGFALSQTEKSSSPDTAMFTMDSKTVESKPQKQIENGSSLTSKTATPPDNAKRAAFFFLHKYS
jgi:hypothetical protein